jgi:sulfoxide reductase heme-binding subunit YedZ
MAGGQYIVSSTALWYATRASGIVTLVLLTLTMILGLLTTGRARSHNWPGFVEQELHRRLSIMAVIFLALHVLTSVLDTYVHIGWLAVVVPFASPYARFWVGVGTISLDLMLAVFVSSLLRSRLAPGTWRGIHWLAYGSFPIALAHTFGLGTDAGQLWVDALGALCVLSVVAALAWRIRTVAVREATAPTAYEAPTTQRVEPDRLVSSSRVRNVRHGA